MSVIGELDKYIVLQYSTRVGDDMGGFTLSWTDAASVWAKKWTVSSNEQPQEERVEMARITKFKIRFRYAIKPYWRIKYGDVYYNITGIDPDDKNKFLYVTTEMVV